jgi:hypothetical protein
MPHAREYVVLGTDERARRDWSKHLSQDRSHLGDQVIEQYLERRVPLLTGAGSRNHQDRSTRTSRCALLLISVPRAGTTCHRAGPPSCRPLPARCEGGRAATDSAREEGAEAHVGIRGAVRRPAGREPESLSCSSRTGGRRMAGRDRKGTAQPTPSPRRSLTDSDGPPAR